MMIDKLEAAILQRAERLAAEYAERANRSRERILREAADQLRIREEREVLLAKMQAERGLRRSVQSSELKLHAQIDRLRWNLVRNVEQRLAVRLSALVLHEAVYFPVLRDFLAEGAHLIECNPLIAAFNSRDYQRLEPIWSAFATAACPDKTIMLARDPLDTVGGVLIHSVDGRIRLDNTFEGRHERLRSQLHQVIVERLLPPGSDNSSALES